MTSKTNIIYSYSAAEVRSRKSAGCNRGLPALLRAGIASALIAGCTLLGGYPLEASAEPIYIEPLFEYPVAPEELTDLQSKCDYLMMNFWNPMNFSSQASIDQNALNDAFGVYVTAMPYADRKVVLASVDNLVKKIRLNPTLTLQFVKAAEETLYGSRANIWSDEAYIPFLKAVVSNKKLSETRRQRYQMQLDLLQNNAPGQKIPKLRLTQRDGKHRDWQPTKGKFTLVEFGNPGCEDCNFAKMKLSMAGDLEDMIEAGQLEIAFIVPDAVPEEQAEILADFAGYPEFWTIGICYGADDKFDLRRTPSFYLLDTDGKILAKNLTVSDAVDSLRQEVANANKNKKK